MPQRSNSVQSGPIVSDERLRNILRTSLHIAINVDRELTRETLAAQSGVNIYTLDAITSRDPAKHRSVKAADMMSIAVVLGPRTVNAVLSSIGYAATNLDDAAAHSPALDAANMMGEVARFAKCAADNIIDHTEEPETTEAADNIISLALPYSSKRDAA